MFHWKKKPQEPQPLRIILRGARGVRLFVGQVTDLPLREDVILQKSIEFFNDPTPCYLHRGAVMTRLYMELFSAFSPLESGESASIPAAELGAVLGYLEHGGQILHVDRAR